MKTVTGPRSRKSHIIAYLILLLFAIPNLLFAQPKGVRLFSSCVEAVGDGSGRRVVSFGYENTEEETVVVEESSSVITYNHGQSKKYANSTFLPGKHDKIVTLEFDPDDRVVWEVLLPSGKTKEVSADINSNHCLVTDYIFPYYTPPPGGKLRGSLIGTELNALYERSVSEKKNFNPVSDDIFQIDELQNVYIEVVAKEGQSASLSGELNELVPNLSLPSDFLYNRANYWFPIDRLIELNDFLNLSYARPVFTEIPKAAVWNQGDKSMQSEYARLGFNMDEFGLDGSLVRVGVISNSYNTKGEADLDRDPINGHLPEDGIYVLKDITPPPGFSLSDEGRAMMQIVHDVAPGAELVFRTGFLGELDMAKGITDLADPDNPNGDCDIIVDDITYITEPFFRDGIISKAIDNVATEVSYFSSAGNFGSSSFEGKFMAGSPVNGINGVPHNFGGGTPEDILQKIKLYSGTYTLVLQWDDGNDDSQAITNTDLDIYLATNGGNSILGYNRENTGGAPVEVLPFTVKEDSVYTNILISRASGDSDVYFKYVVFRGADLFQIEEYGTTGSATIVGHANAEGAMTVGAVGYYKEQPGETTIQPYSSMGGSPIITTDVTNGVPRDKPDFIAPDGVNTSVNLGSGNIFDPDNDGAPNFFGTSAAAPHAAGAAALIIQAKKTFEEREDNPSPAEIRQLMRITAIGNTTTGHSPVSGFGFIQPYAAVKTFANPKPEVKSLTIITNESQAENANTGGALDPVKFQIKGNFFVDNDTYDSDRKTKVFLETEEVPTGMIIVKDDQTIVVDHPGFLGKPEIRVKNPAISSSGLDGGESSSISFSTPIKKTVTITAESFTKNYGQSLPDFSNVVFEDGNPETNDHNASIDFTSFAEGEKERIRKRLTFEVNISGDVYAGYILKLVFDEKPDPMLPVDYAIAEKYDIKTIDGSLNIEKLNITITPDDVTLGYGEELTQDRITFKYEGDPNDISPSELTAITESLNVQYTNPLPLGVPLVNGISLVRGTALVNVPEGDQIEVEVKNNGDIYLYSGDDKVLYNGQPLPRGVALVNNIPFVQIKEITEGVGMFNGLEVSIEKMTDGNSYLTAVGDEVLTEPLAVENGIALVRGTALVNGVEVVWLADGSVEVNGTTVRGTALVNGIPVVEGTALVNSEHIVRGIALVNQFVRETALVNIEIPVFHGIPDVDGNDDFESYLEAIAMVNGIPMVRGTALVNGLNVVVEENAIIDVNGEEEDFAFVNGIALVRGTALVNGQNLVRGTALVNNVLETPSLVNINFLASTNALESLPFVNGTPLVNGMLGVDGDQLVDAIVPQTNGYNSVRGIALVNGQDLVNDGAMVIVDGVGSFTIRGTALVNEAISTESNGGAIVINHDAEESSSYIPVTFITGTDVGDHKIVPGTFLSKNFNVSYGVGTLTIKPAELLITADDATKEYGVVDDPDLKLKSYKLDANDEVVAGSPGFDGAVTSVTLYGSDKLKGELFREGEDLIDPIGEDVATYDIFKGTLTAGSNYNIIFTDDQGNLIYPGQSLASLAIKKAPLTISADHVTKPYGMLDDPPLTFTYDKDELKFNDGISDAVSGSLVRVGGTDATTYAITRGTLKGKDNYYIFPFSGSTFTINKATLTITPDANGKNYDGDDPPLNIKSYKLDNNDEVVAVIDPTDPELFDGTVEDVVLYYGDQLTGSYSIAGSGDVGSYYDAILLGIPAITDNNGYSKDHNYTIDVTPSMFYINPYGPGTRAIKPVLNCIQEQGDDFVAFFEYKNDNEDDVFIPVGENNLLEGDIISIWDDYGDLDHQPTLFKKGGGQFWVKFSGDELRWTVNSLDEDHKASNAANANSSSTKCNDNTTKSAKVSAAIEPEDPMASEELMVYPNPVTNTVNLVMKDIQDYRMITLLDMAGRVQPIASIKTRPDLLEIDMSNMAKGTYFIRVVMEDTAKVIQVIKL